MKGKIVVKYECQRCPKVWYEDADGEQHANEKSPPCLLVSFPAKSIEIKWDVLCPSCLGTVSNYIKALSKDLKSKPRGRKPEAKSREGGLAPLQDADRNGPNDRHAGNATRARPI